MTSTTVTTTEFNLLKNEVKNLKKKVSVLIDKLREKDGYEDITSDELLLNASHIFDVSSKSTKDDDNIADPTKIKPIDFSKYA